MGDVLKEAAAIRVAMGELGWDYIGGGPYPSAPNCNSIVAIRC